MLVMLSMTKNLLKNYKLNSSKTLIRIFFYLSETFKSNMDKTYAMFWQFRQNIAYLNRLHSNKHSKFVSISCAELVTRIWRTSYAFSNQHHALIYFREEVLAICSSDDRVCTCSNACCATSSHAHCPEHDLSSYIISSAHGLLIIFTKFLLYLLFFIHSHLQTMEVY